MSTPTSDITSSTLQILRDRFVEGIFRTTAFMEWAEKNGVIQMVEGGSKIQHPTVLAEHSTITNLGGGGYNPVSYTVGDPLKLAEFNWCNFSAPVVLTKVEETANRSELARISILEARLKAVLGMEAREWEKQVLAGSSTILTDLETFNGIDAATGWFEELAVGSQANSVGGIAKASYATGWQNQVGNAAAAFATNGLSQMQAIVIQAMTYTPEGQIDGIFASPTSFGLYKDQLQSQERYMSGDPQIDGGKLKLAFAGAPMFVSQHLGYTGSGGTKASMLFLNSKSLTVYFDRDGKFELLPKEPISGYLAHKQDVFVRTQVCLSHLSSMGILVNGEA